MAGVVTIGSVWATGDQPTAAVLNAKWTSCEFSSNAVDGVTTALSSGAIIVRDLGISPAKLATDSVVTAKILDENVTFAKLTDVIDDDAMATASATKLATSESIKAYVDGDSSFNTSEGYQKLPGGLIIQFGHRTTDGVSGFTTTTFPTSFATKCMFVNIVEEGGSHRNFNIRNIGVSSFQSEAITTASNEARYFAIGF